MGARPYIYHLADGRNYVTAESTGKPCLFSSYRSSCGINVGCVGIIQAIQVKRISISGSSRNACSPNGSRYQYGFKKIAPCILWSGHGTWPCRQRRTGFAGNAANGKPANGHAVFTHFWSRLHPRYAGGGGHV